MAKQKVVFRVLVRSGVDDKPTSVTFLRRIEDNNERTMKEYSSPTRTSLRRLHAMYMERDLDVCGTGFTTDYVAFILRPWLG